MTDRELFERVRDHLLAQRERAISPDGLHCRYRVERPDGTVLRCAVGCLIPPERYGQEMEGTAISEGYVHPVLCQAGILPGVSDGRADRRRIDMLFRLQRIHDMRDPREWETLLAGMADMFDPDGAWDMGVPLLSVPHPYP